MKHRLLGIQILLLTGFSLVLGSSSAWQAEEKAGDLSRNTTQQQPNSDEQATAPTRITLPAGATISVRIADVVNSNKNRAGDLLTGIVDPSVFVDNHVVIPRGTEAHVRLMEDEKGGHLRGKAEVRLELIGLVLNQEKVDVDTDEYHKKQGALSAKFKNAGNASAASGTSAATSNTPEGGVVGPVLAVFRAAKIDMPAGTRVAFKLMSPFTLDKPAEQAVEKSSPQ